MGRLDQTGALPFEAALLRAARAALGWGLVEAGRRARMSAATVFAAEGGREWRPPKADVEALRRAYEEAGVRSFDDGAAGCGIRVTATSPSSDTD